MTSAEVRRYSANWFTYVRTAAEVVVARRARLVVHHPVVMHEHLVSLVVPGAELAVDGILLAVENRVKDFRSRAMQRGPNWDILQEAYLAARAQVRAVWDLLSLHLAMLVEDEYLYPLPADKDISVVPIVILHLQPSDVHNELEFRTNQFLVQAQALFVGGGRHVGPVPTIVHASDVI